MRKLVVVLALGVTALASSISLAQGSNGSLAALFQDKQGTALYAYSWSERRWRPITPNFSDLGSPAPVGDGRFLALSHWRLVLVGSNMRPINTELEEVSSFSLNEQHNLIYLLGSTGHSAQRRLDVLEWPSGRQLQVLEPTVPLGVGSDVTSCNDLIMVRGTDGQIYRGTVGEYNFVPLVAGRKPKLSPSGGLLAYVAPQDGRLSILDLKTGQVRPLGARWVGWLAWLSEDTLAYTYEYYSWLPLVESFTRLAVVDIRTGVITELPQPSLPLGVAKYEP